jgi:hypothetical protein
VKKTHFLKQTKIILIVLSFFDCSQLFGQTDWRTGYIVKLNNDSLPGLVAYMPSAESQKHCYFKTSRKAAREKFNPREIKAYGFIGDKRYESKKMPDGKVYGTVFVEMLVKGVASLFLFDKSFFYEKDSIVRLPKSEKTKIKRDGKSYFKEDKRYIGLLNIQLADCDLSANKTKYKQDDFINLIQNYNRCKGKVGLFYKHLVPSTRFDFQIFSGPSISTLSIADRTFSTSKTIIAGARVDFSTPRIFDRFFLTADVLYVPNFYQSYSEQVEPISIIRTDEFLHINFLSIPFGVRYNFLKEGNTPYLKTGVSTIVTLSSEYRVVQETEKEGTVTTNLSNQIINSEGNFGFWIALGYDFSFHSQLKMSSELRYGQNNGVIGGIDPKSQINYFTFFIGLRF